MATLQSDLTVRIIPKHVLPAPISDVFNEQLEVLLLAGSAPVSTIPCLTHSELSGVYDTASFVPNDPSVATPIFLAATNSNGHDELYSSETLSFIPTKKARVNNISDYSCKADGTQKVLEQQAIQDVLGAQEFEDSIVSSNINSEIYEVIYPIMITLRMGSIPRCPQISFGMTMMKSLPAQTVCEMIRR